jgi:alpha/beta superfamily hydrolase
MDPGGHRYGSEETNDIGAVLRLMQQHRQEHPELPISLFSAPPFGPIHEP